MSTNESGRVLLAILEDTLVAEFLAYQALVELTKEERRLLPGGDLDKLMALISCKQQLLAKIDHLERKRQDTIMAWTQLGSHPVPPASLANMLPWLDGDFADRLGRLRQGILVLIEQQRDLARGNRLLVDTALEQVQAVRDFLIRLCDRPMGYQAPGMAAPLPAMASLAVERMA